MKVQLYENSTLLDAAKDMVANIDNSDFSLEHVIIVPDKFSLQMEKLVLDILPNKALFNVRVVGLTMLANYIFALNNKKIDILSSGETLLLTEQAINNVQDQLYTFKKNNIAFCHEINKIISQLKSSCVFPEDLNIAAPGMSGKKYHDISLIYQEYQRLLNGRADANERLALLNEVIKQSSLANHKFYFAMFDSFTSEGYLIIKSLIEKACEVNISIAQPLSIGNEYIYEKDIYQKMMSLSKELGIVFDVKKFPTKFSNVKEGIVRGLYSYEKYHCENKGYYNLIVASNLEEEVLSVAKTIFYLINNGYRYKDICIFASDLEKYTSHIEKIFTTFDFPYYIDSTTTADKTLLSSFISLIMETIIFGYANDKLVSLFSHVLFKDDELVQLCQKYQVAGKQKYKKYLAANFKFDSIIEKLSSASTSQEISKIILELCDELQEELNNVMLQLEDKGYIKEKNINIQAYDIVKETLSLIDKYSSEISLQDYYKKFNLLMSFKQVSTVPSFVDGIFVGDANTSTSLGVRAMFILGGQSLPIASGDKGILNDEDIALNFINKKIEPTIRMINRRNRFRFFNLLTLSEKRLFVFCQAKNDEGKKNEFSSFIQSLNEIFGQREMKASLLFDLYETKTLKHLKLSLGNRNNFISEYYSKLNEKTKENFGLKGLFGYDDLNINKNNISADAKALYFSKDRVRVTELEQYFSCPFKHFLTYGIKVKEKDSFAFDARDLGNVCHRGAELLVGKIINDKYDLNQNIEEFIDKNFAKILQDENLNEKLDALDEKEYLIRYLQKQLYVVCQDILREMEVSDFKPVATEITFNNIYLGNENKVRMIGKADRVDENEGYFRIIDYKTGKTGNVIKELYFGNKLQLFLYQKAYKEKTSVAPAGIFYFNAKFEYGNDEEDKVLLNGVVANEDKIIKMLDQNLADGKKSKIVPISAEKSSINDNYKGSAISQLPLKVYEDYAQKIADKCVDEIMEGYIAPKPYGDACKYCQYLSICLKEKIEGERKHKKAGDFKSE